MSLVSRPSLDLSLSALAHAPSAAFAVAHALARNLVRRRAAYRVSELPDYLLTDIGLKRDDVHAALNADWREDPTLRLKLSALARRDMPKPTRRP